MPGVLEAGDLGSAGQKVSGVTAPAVGPIEKLVAPSCRPGVLDAAGLGSAGQDVKGVKGPAVGPTRKLLLQAGGLESWMLQAWDLLARMLRELSDQLWALPFLSKEYISSRGGALSVPYRAAPIFLCKINISGLNP